MALAPSRMVTVGNADFPRFEYAQDPSEIVQYQVDFINSMGGGSITSQTVTLDSGSAAVGISISIAPRAPSHNNGFVQFWLECSQPTNAAFVIGVEAVVTITAVTNNNPAATIQRSVRVLVKQSDTPSLTALAPITLPEAKAHLRVAQGDTEDDEYIISLINVAATALERMTGHVMRARNVTFNYDVWQSNAFNRIPLWRGPANSVVSVVYDDTAGVQRTLASNQYRLREYALQPCIVPATGITWPEAEPIPGSIRVTYNAGYASNAAVPEPFKQAAKLLIGHWFENREAVMVGATSGILDMAVNTLIDGYRLKVMA